MRTRRIEASHRGSAGKSLSSFCLSKWIMVSQSARASNCPRLFASLCQFYWSLDCGHGSLANSSHKSLGGIPSRDFREVLTNRLPVHCLLAVLPGGAESPLEFPPGNAGGGWIRSTFPSYLACRSPFAT